MELKNRGFYNRETIKNCVKKGVDCEENVVQWEKIDELEKWECENSFEEIYQLDYEKF